jgi:hydroxymethylpyrimidine pyrophosphatase-like HAD family hydrolase
MKLSAVALDYDGTIARDGLLDPDVLRAITRLRAHGITILLVTGRILDDLKRLNTDLHFVDVIVAENGAVVEFPDSGHSTCLGEPPPAAFLDALRREQIVFAVGRSIVDIDAGEAERVLRIIRQLELPLALVFNRSRLMVLPQAISKATGLRYALTVLRLSTHNTVAIGDAENDHELLRICELGVAVAWGSHALQAAADEVAPGGDPSALAAYLDHLLVTPQIPTPRRIRRHVLLGHADDGRAFSLAVRGRNALVAGDPRSGKSWVAGLLCEQLILHSYCLCILDPEGDYTSLQALPGVTVFGGADPLPRPRELLRALRHPDVSVIVDLSHAREDEKREYLRTVLPGLATLRRRTGLPHRIVVDEAHYFLQDEDVRSMLDLELNGYMLITYRASQLHPSVLAANHAVIVTCESDPVEVEALRRLCRCDAGSPSAEQWAGLLGSLVVGEAMVLPITDEAEGQMRRIRLAPRLTPHVRHLNKYIDIPVAQNHAFMFGRASAPAGPRARTLREFVAILDGGSAIALDDHLRRGDVSRWVAEVFGDYPLAAELRTVEQRYRDGALTDPGVHLTQAIRARYEFIEDVPRVESS